MSRNATPAENLPSAPTIPQGEITAEQFAAFVTSYEQYFFDCEAEYQKTRTIAVESATKNEQLTSDLTKLKAETDDTAARLRREREKLKTEGDQLRSEKYKLKEEIEKLKKQPRDQRKEAEEKMSTFKVRPFSGEKGDDDWASWRSNFNMVCLGNGWDDKTGKAAAYIAMKGRAARATRNIKTSDADKVTDLLDKFEKVFLPESATAYAMSLFQLAKQEEGESSLDWHTRIGDLYARAYPSKTDSETSAELILRFCHGFRDRSLVFRLYNPKPKTFSEALEKAQADEASSHIASDGRGAGATSKKIASLSTTEDLLASLGISPSCWYCQQKGHIKAECPKRKRNAMSRNSGRGGTFNRGARPNPTPTYS